MKHCRLLVLLPLLLAGCGRRHADYTVLERAHAGPLTFSVRSEGGLRSTQPTPLLVPGQQWTARQVDWMLPDGSVVKKGEVVARFSATQSRQDLVQARIDLARNTLARAGKEADLAAKSGQLGVDLTEVGEQRTIAERYAHATLASMARNDILDAVQDVHYLDVRQHILHWREDQSSARGHAELAVLDAQRSSFDTVVKQKQEDLDALELRAPHAGVLMLEKDWSQQVPHVGSSLFAGNSFATLPDLGALEVQLMVPQIEAQGIQVGDVVELHRWGLPAQAIRTKISWVASAAQPRSRDNPVKYLAVKVRVPAAQAQAKGWVPGQRFVGNIILLKVKDGFSVPNVALARQGDQASVKVLVDDDKVVARHVRLGVQGPTRTQVLSGLMPGDRIVLDAAGSGAMK